jgi:hypothetical protein
MCEARVTGIENRLAYDKRLQEVVDEIGAAVAPPSTIVTLGGNKPQVLFNDG